MVIEPVHCGSSSILKVRFIGTPCALYSHVAISITTTNNTIQGATQSVGLDNYYALVAI